MTSPSPARGASLRDILNRARWRDAGLDTLVVHVLHRGAPGDRREIAGKRIVAVKGGGIDVAPEGDALDPQFVPYHRFLAIFGPDGEEMWSKERGEPVAAEPAPVAAAPEIAADIEVVLAREPRLTIDGSAGEGGGQMLRTSLSLAMVTGTPFVLEKIRAGRKKPGLLRQHLTAVNAAAALCGAKVEGAALGSERLVFEPGPVVGGTHTLDIGSAGSAGLVLQTIALPLCLASTASRITIKGGTHALWAPPYPFLAEAWLPLVRRAGAGIALALGQVGFHPAGGGVLTLDVEPSALVPLHVGEGGVVGDLVLRAIVAGIPEAVGERELDAAAELLGDHRLDRATATVKAEGKGNAMWLVARDEATGVANVFTGIGEVGVRAETIGAAVAKDFLAWRASGAAVEEHLSDQLMLPIALAGAGSFTCPTLSLHARTNIAVIAAFTGRKLRVTDLGGRLRIALG